MERRQSSPGLCKRNSEGQCAILVSIFLLLASLCTATLEEGSILIQLMRSWRVNFQSWIPAEDPCQWEWQGVSCLDGHVVGINLTNKGLRGGIPSAMGQLTYLTTLDLSNNLVNFTTVGPWNTLTGNLPDELSNLQYLQVLNLNYLELNIPFPAVVLRLRNLITLNMGNANLSGTLPEELGRLSKLQTLWLSNNSFRGGIPSAIGTLQDLSSLSLSYIPFDSSLPANLGDLSQLTYMNIHDSGVWGGLPASFGRLKNLQRLLLYDNQLTGFIPDQWQDMTSLKQLSLQKNYLSGLVPSWLFRQPNLTELRLQQNQFQGVFPSFVDAGHFVKLDLQCNYFIGPFPNVSLDIVDGNCFTNITDNGADNSGRTCQRNLACDAFLKTYPPGICAPCPPSSSVLVANANCTCSPLEDFSPGGSSKSRSFPAAPVLGAALAVIVILGLAISFFLWRSRGEAGAFVDVFSTKSTRESTYLGGEPENLLWDIPQGVHRYTFQTLSRATNNFDAKNEIGVGGFGKVFLGAFPNGKLVAIKRASSTSMQGLHEFHNEIALLSRLHHRHLVRLEGFCDDLGLQILVYEFVTNGNLFSLLFGTRLAKPLHWYKRLEIAVGVAQGLEYLHSYADPPVIHRDVKPSNILLDDNFNPKLSDFGISRVNKEIDTHISTRPVGTAGYLDPQYFLQTQLTAASDVYGFGMVLLELVTGQKAIDHERENGYNLVEWARPRFRNGGIEAIVDPAFEEYSHDALFAMADIAIKCTAFERQERPSIKVVLGVLEAHIQQVPSQLPTPVSSFSLPPGESFTDILRWTESPDELRCSTDLEKALLSTAANLASSSDVTENENSDHQQVGKSPVPIVATGISTSPDAE